MTFPVETIPDGDTLYMRVHKTFVKNGELRPSVFVDREGGISTDWKKYATPQQAQGRTRIPSDNGVISLVAGPIRAVPLTVVHEPLDDNQAHTEVFGEKSEEVRVKLRRIFAWEIKI